MSSKHSNKFIKIFVPKLAFDHLHYKLSVNPPKFVYEIESFYSILNDLSNIKYYKDYIDNNEMIPMYSKLLQKKYGNNYNLYMQYLGANSIISGSTHYKKGMCYYYHLVLNKHIDDMLNREYYNQSYCLNTYKEKAIQVIDINGVIPNTKRVKNIDVVAIKIPVISKVGKYIKKEYNREIDRIKHYPPHVKAMAQYFKNTIGISYEEAMNFTFEQYQTDIKSAGDNEDLRNTAYDKHNHRIRSIIEISEGKKCLRFGRNRTNRRVDTNLTNMARELRPFLNDFENLSYLDLCNSQPVLFNIMLAQYSIKKNKKLAKEIEEYRLNTISGYWYEMLMPIYKVDRDTAKEKWMQIAYSKNKSYRKEKKVFGRKFPEIAKIIESKKKKKHAAFSVELQTIESKIFIDGICKKLVENDIVPYTLHDGVLVPKDKEAQTYTIMTEVLKSHLGEIPVISVNNTKVYPQKQV